MTTASPSRGGRTVLDCRDLSVVQGGRTLIDRVSFRIEAGEAYVLFGPPHSGKSLMVELVCGLRRPDRGSVTLTRGSFDDASDGRPLHVGAAIGYAPQDAASFADMSARDNLRFFGSLQGLSGERLRARTQSVLEDVELAAQAGERVDRQPPGARRRLSLAIALLVEPALLVLDDPATGADPRSRDLILGSVTKAVSRGTAVLYATRDAVEAERVCGRTGRVGLLGEGRLVAEGRPAELRARMAGYQRVVLHLPVEARAALRALAEAEGVLGAMSNDGRVEVTVEDAHAMLPRLVARLAADGLVLERVEVLVPDLESIALFLAGRDRASR